MLPYFLATQKKNTKDVENYPPKVHSNFRKMSFRITRQINIEHCCFLSYGTLSNDIHGKKTRKRASASIHRYIPIDRLKEKPRPTMSLLSPHICFMPNTGSASVLQDINKRERMNMGGNGNKIMTITTTAPITY